MSERPEPTPAALYARVSSDRQDVDLSVAAQLRALRDHAADSPTGKLLEAIIESMDEFYSENLANEVTRGMREAASRRASSSATRPHSATSG